jgi:hypothetical protein
LATDRTALSARFSESARLFVPTLPIVLSSDIGVSTAFQWSFVCGSLSVPLSHVLDHSLLALFASRLYISAPLCHRSSGLSPSALSRLTETAVSLAFHATISRPESFVFYDSLSIRSTVVFAASAPVLVFSSELPPSALSILTGIPASAFRHSLALPPSTLAHSSWAFFPSTAHHESRLCFSAPLLVSFAILPASALPILTEIAGSAFHHSSKLVPSARLYTAQIAPSTSFPLSAAIRPTHTLSDPTPFHSPPQTDVVLRHSSASARAAVVVEGSSVALIAGLAIAVAALVIAITAVCLVRHCGGGRSLSATSDSTAGEMAGSVFTEPGQLDLLSYVNALDWEPIDNREICENPFE